MAEKDLVFQSNPNAEAPNNMLVPYISKSYKTLAVQLTYTINAGATSIALTASAPANNTLSYYRITVTDGNGVEAVGAFDVTNIAGGATVNTTNLDKDTDWRMQIVWAEPTNSQESPKFDSVERTLTGAKGSATDSFTTAETAGTLQIAVALVVNGVVTVAKANVADTGTAAFGNVAQNADAYAIVYFSNTATGQKPLKVLSIVDNGAAMTAATAFADRPYLPLAIGAADESASTLKVALDTTVLGAIAASSITIASNDPANASYVVNFSATIV